MSKEEAQKLLLQFIEISMSKGIIQNFETLDKLREAIKVLSS